MSSLESADELEVDLIVRLYFADMVCLIFQQEVANRTTRAVQIDVEDLFNVRIVLLFSAFPFLVLPTWV